MSETIPALVLNEVGLKIGGARILEDVSFSVQQGEMIGVIGPNGAGKTTLFNLISGIMTPTEGQIELNGENITKMAVHKRALRGLGRTFQTSSLFPALSLLENVRIAAQVGLGGSLSLFARPHAKDQASLIALDRLEEVGLREKHDIPAAGLSHGEKRKLEIAVLLATNPQVILFDEPMAGVASGDVPGLVEIIRRLHKELGNTIVLVEHHIDVVLGLVDKVAVMHHGKLLAFDTPDAIMANPVVQSAYLGETL
ncbi:MAG: ABC transporter ATP-binding protein [Microbacteriaceae bacterium]